MTVDIRIPPRRDQDKPRLDDGQRAHRAARDYGPGRRESRKQDGARTDSRFLLEPLSGHAATMPAYDAPYVVEGRTKYPQRRRDASQGPVLKSGVHQAKIGGTIITGKWAGMPVYCLTLEERATCPAHCQMWRCCYGNAMNWAMRYQPGPELEERLRQEIGILARQHSGGFVVRLHILGDFYSLAYVGLWIEMLATYPQLRIYGYTARWKRDDPIAMALAAFAMESWDRFAMRFSNAPIDTCSTVTIEHAAACPPDAIICPVQLGTSESCSTCALCWQTDKRIAFIRH
jgi:hypothetical protein